VTSVEGSGNTWKVSDLHEVIPELRHVVGPSDHLLLQGEDGCRHPMNCPVNCVGGRASGVSHQMKKAVGASEVQKRFQLLARCQWLIPLRTVLEDWTKPFF
jgi:hypothetical protein